MNRSTSGRLVVLLTSLALLLAACGGGGDGDTAEGGASEPSSASSEPAVAAASEPAEDVERGNIAVGSTNFTEQELVAEMYALALEEAGYTVERRYQLGAREVVFPALQGGEIDVIPEYIGTLLEFLNGGAGEATSDTQETLELLREELGDAVTVLEPSEAQDKNALAVTQQTAEDLGVEAVSGLEGQAGDLVLGGPPECPQRPLCLPGYQDVYGLEFANFQALDAGGPLTTEALNSGDIDVGLVFSTQGAIAANDWVVLDDDEGLQPAENITPAVRSEVLTDDLRQVLNDVSATLTTEKVIELNKRIDVDGEPVAEVAESFLTDEGVLGG